MSPAFICDALRTPIGRFKGALSTVRADDLAAIPIKALMVRHGGLDWEKVDDVILGCANQAGEDNRNVARMALLLAGLPEQVTGVTLNRLCGSGLDAIGTAARAVAAGEAELLIAGGVESMSRAPYVLGKAETAFARGQQMEDTTMGWRFVNPAMQRIYGVDSMPATAENIASEWGISREDQDRFALASQTKAAAAQQSGRFEAEIVPVSLKLGKGDHRIVERDEHPRATSLDALAGLPAVVHPNGTVTAGNASGINDGAAAALIASEAAAARHGLTPRARIIGMCTIGVPPRIMGIGPVGAITKLLERHRLSLSQIDVIELNEAFASQAIAVLRDLGLTEDDPRINPNGGAIALGHPLGMSGARLAIAATGEICRSNGRYALVAMCVGVGQGIAMLIERV